MPFSLWIFLASEMKEEAKEASNWTVVDNFLCRLRVNNIGATLKEQKDRRKKFKSNKT